MAKKKQEVMKPLHQQMQEVHPIHGVFAEVFERLGGVPRMEEWANANYTDFMRIFSKMAPRPMNNDASTQIEINVHPLLGRSPLDG